MRINKPIFRKIEPDKIKKAVVVIAFLSFYMAAAKAITGYTCFFMSTIGFPCPGCGLTRAFVCFFSGDLRGALYYHPLFWLVPIVLAVIILKRLFAGSAQKKWYTRFLCFSASLFIAVYAVRLALYFPHTPPFVLNPRSFTQRLFYLLTGFFT